MGASHLTMAMDGNLTQAQVRAKFEDIQAQHAHEDGCSYSGQWNMCRGLTFPNPGFKEALPEKEAYDWLGDHCNKWEDAKAIRCIVRKPASKPTFTFPPGYRDSGSSGEFGKAWRIAYKQDSDTYRITETLVKGADALSLEDRKAICEAVIKSKDADRAERRARDMFQKAINALNGQGKFDSEEGMWKPDTTPLPDEFYAKLPALRLAAFDATKALRAAEAALKDLDDKLGDPLMGYKDETIWLIGGTCAS